MKNMFIALITFLFLTFSNAQNTTDLTITEDALTGTWKNEEKGVTIKIYEQNGDYFGKIIAIDDPEKNNQIQGKNLLLLKDFQKTSDANYCCGTVEHFGKKRTFNGTIQLINDNLMQLKVSFRGMSRIQKWIKK